MSFFTSLSNVTFYNMLKHRIDCFRDELICKSLVLSYSYPPSYVYKLVDMGVLTCTNDYWINEYWVRDALRREILDYFEKKELRRVEEKEKSIMYDDYDYAW